MDNYEESSSAVEVLSTSALEALSRAEIDMQIATAKKYPRNIGTVKARIITLATLDQETAEACFYTLKRKDKDGNEKLIQGPSIRLAEIALSCYQNIRAGSRPLSNDGKRVTSQGVCLDLENNVFVSMETTRSITTRAGKSFGEDMQTTATNANNAIAFRNAVFKVIPMALVKPALEQAKLKAVGTGSTLTKWSSIVKRATGAFGVTEKQILDLLEKKTNAEVTDDDCATIIGIFTSIRDGEAKIEEIFAPKENSAGDAKQTMDEKARKMQEEQTQQSTDGNVSENHQQQSTGDANGNTHHEESKSKGFAGKSR